jgi:hypothetical protein
MPDGSIEDSQKKVSVAQEMLGRVIHTTDNLDEKVGRIFSSMSFLAVGATILYTSFLADKIAYKAGGVDLVSLFFVLFMVSVAVSTALMLEAMGPRFHLNPWGRRESASSMKPTPTGYADRIAQMEKSEWSDYFAKIQLVDLYEKWYAEAMDEVYVLSRKVNRKVGEMRNAQRTFLLAILFLVLMVVFGVSSYL